MTAVGEWPNFLFGAGAAGPVRVHMANLVAISFGHHATKSMANSVLKAGRRIGVSITDGGKHGRIPAVAATQSIAAGECEACG